MNKWKQRINTVCSINTWQEGICFMGTFFSIKFLPAYSKSQDKLVSHDLGIQSTVNNRRE